MWYYGIKGKKKKEKKKYWRVNLDFEQSTKRTYHNPLPALCETTETMISNSSFIPIQIVAINIIVFSILKMRFKQTSVPKHTYSISYQNDTNNLII